MAQPKCNYFRKCGGCSAQHLEYQTQLDNKKQQLANAINFQDIEVFSDEPYEYRNRMDFIFHKEGLGFRKAKNWKSTVDIENCPIANSKINKLLTELRTYFKGVEAFDQIKKQGLFRYAVIRATTLDNSVSFILNEDHTAKQKAIEYIKEYAENSSANNIMVGLVSKNSDISITSNTILIKGTETLKETLNQKTFYFSIQGFFQNNSKMAEKMQVYTHALLEKYETKDAHLLDLYGGVGTFGIMNADLFKRVHIVEEVPQAIENAKQNIVLNNVSNAEAICKDAKAINKLHLPSPLYVITDPPRSGMHPRTLQFLNAYRPEVIIYISCNVEQLKKDIIKFPEYKIKSAALFDLFPQTPHSEAIVELVKKEL